MRFILPAFLLIASCVACSAQGDDLKRQAPVAGPGDKALAAYFDAEVSTLEKATLAGIHSAGDWQKERVKLQAEFQEMLGLSPWPERTDLKATITGKLDHAEFTVEKVHFQSRPGLYVTGNLYIPKGLTSPAPAVLYVCGHGTFKKDNIAYGSKVPYQHWAAWFARNGYVFLIVDTLQLGEIEGIHHGLYRENMWWWQSRGYTPAGVEAWNAIRALDYLSTRTEVDKNRLGVTGRSGGGATSWWLAALDERVKVACPTAGITDLRNHVVDGVIEGHCDCMFMVNTYRWDFAQVSAMVAPRPLLFENTDKDTIFPLDGVYRTFTKARGVYELLKPAESAVPADATAKPTAATAKMTTAEKDLGLLITEGPHKDTQDLQVPTMRWFNRHLKGDDSPVKNVAEKFFEPEQLRVFKAGEEPKDQINTKIHDTFVAAAPAPKVPASQPEWAAQRDESMKQLRTKSLGGWPAEQAAGALAVKLAYTETARGLTLSAYDFTSQHDVQLRLFLLHLDKLDKPELVVLRVLDDKGWREWAAEVGHVFPRVGEGTLAPAEAPAAAESIEYTQKMLVANKWVMAYVAPRGVGPTEFTRDARKRIHLLRRFGLIGQTLDGMQAYDIGRAVQATRTLPIASSAALWIQAERRMAANAVYASLFEPEIARLDLHEMPTTHGAAAGPQLLNVLRFMDLPMAVAMAAERSKVVIYAKGEEAEKTWEYPIKVAAEMKWGEKRVQIRAEK